MAAPQIHLLPHHVAFKSSPSLRRGREVRFGSLTDEIAEAQYSESVKTMSCCNLVGRQPRPRRDGDHDLHPRPAQPTPAESPLRAGVPLLPKPRPAAETVGKEPAKTAGRESVRQPAQEPSAVVGSHTWPIIVPLTPESRHNVLIYHHELQSMVSGIVPCWTYVSQGLADVGQKEVVFTIKRRASESQRDYPREPLEWFQILHPLAREGQIVDCFHQTTFSRDGFLGRSDIRAILYYPPTGLSTVPPEYLPKERLHAIALTVSEVEVMERCGLMRVISSLGFSERYFPVTPWIDRDRKSCVTIAEMDEIIREVIPFWDDRSTSAFRRGTDIVLHIPQKSESGIQKLVRGLPLSGAIGISSVPYSESDSGVLYRRADDNLLKGYGTGLSCTNLAFIVFCPEQDEDEFILTEDGYSMLLTNSTWAVIRDAVLTSRPISVTIGDFRFCLEYAAEQKSTQQKQIQTTYKTTNSALAGSRPSRTPAVHNCGGCIGSNGLCKVLKSQSAVHQLLRGEKVLLFSGPKAQLERCASQGCAFAKLIYPGSDDEITHFLQRADQGPANQMLLLSILRGDQTPDRGYHVAVSTTPDDPAWSVVGMDRVNPDPLSARSIGVMDEWLQQCSSRLQGHNECVRWDARAVTLPTRVIDVRGQVPRLCTPSSNESGRYATLTYCWGGPQPHSTTTARLAGYHKSLPMDSFPTTIRDAIALTRALKIPYLWIDSLCIIQDSEPDKTKEIAKMSQVYKNSWVTFSAATASTCRDGFLGIQGETRNRLERSVTISLAGPDGLTGSIMLTPARFNGVNLRFEDKFPIDRRAWTYQEYLLSPRVISFYHDYIEFKCPGGLLSDDGLKAEEERLNPPIFARTSKLGPLFFLQDSEITPNLRRKAVSPEARKVLRQLWDNVVSEYTPGRLTNPDDKLPAVSALASEFHRIFGDEYLAGLWKGNLMHDLQWFAFPPSHGESPVPKYHVPSWSWASVTNYSVYPHEASKYSVQSTRAEILNCSVDLVSEEATFGQVKGGLLTIRGPIKSLSLREAWQHFGCGPRADQSKTIGMIDPDFRWKVPKDGSIRSEFGIPEDRGPLFFLGLSMQPGDKYETCGLTLLETADNQYERFGLFKVGAADDLIAIPSWHQQVATERWGNDYEVRTVSIR